MIEALRKYNSSLKKWRKGQPKNWKKSTNPLKKTKKKQLKETIQDLKTEIEATKKTQTEENLEIKNLDKQSGTTDPSINNRIQEIEKRLSGIEDTIEVIDSSVKENAKPNKFLTQNIQEIWNTMKRRNLRVMEIEEREVFQLKGTENILSKVIEENFPT